MTTSKEFRMGLRLLIMALVFLAMSCESDGEGGDCLGSTDELIVGFGDGCGTGCTMAGKGCIGECLMGSNEGCSAGEGCMGDCGGCDACGECNVPHYRYEEDVVEGAVQVHVTDSLFRFVESELDNIIKVAAADMLDAEDYCRRCNAGTETWDCGNCADWQTHCLAPVDASQSGFSIQLCNRGYNCNVDGNLQGPNNGCKVHVKLGQMDIDTSTTGADSRVSVHVPFDDLYAKIPSRIVGDCMIELGKKQNGRNDLNLTVGANLRLNPVDGNIELYVGDETFSANLDGLQDKSNCAVTNIAGGIPSLLRTAVDSIGAMTCRGCETDADCGGGSTCGSGKTCTKPNGTNQHCSGLQLGADMKVDAAGLLASIDPGAEGLLGVRAFLGSYVSTNIDGLQIGGRIGANAEAPSLCVPVRPSPIQANTADCRIGDRCNPLEQLNAGDMVKNPATGQMEPFHIGAGVAMGGLNQVLWSVYRSGMLCLSVGGESEGLDMLSTDLFATFIGSLSSLTYNTGQPLMIQLRPQQAPEVDFLENQGQGAELRVKIPELEIDFYTIVDHRYARIFTLGADIELPLGMKGESNTMEIALGDLANVIDPDTVSVTNVEMVSGSQVQSLVNNLPTLLGALTGLLGDELIPPIEIPEFNGIQLKFVGPGLTMVEENGLPAALGAFIKMDIDAEELGGAFTALEPEITNLDIDIREPKALRADIAARRRADQSFSYTDLMPKIVAQMSVTGADLDDHQVEYAYSINRGPWSYWERGPQLVIDNPILAAEAKFDVRITARVAGDASTGSASHAEFSLVNDYSAPTVTLDVDGSTVQVTATDNVYSTDELSMQYRFGGGQWTEPSPIQNIDILPQLLAGEVTVDVIVADPSGNGRSVRRSFGAVEKTTGEEPATTGGGGCSTSQGNGGLAAVLALLALVFLRRRERGSDKGAVIEASTASMAFFILGALLLGLVSTGCKSKNAGQGDCSPSCTSAQVCVDGTCEALLCSSDQDCSLLDSCMDGVCVANDICEYADDCDYGHICKNGVCRPSECQVSDDCDASACEAPELPYCEYDDYASVEAGECVCAAGVPMGRHGGWLNVLALDSGETTVALAFSEQYGDLIFGTLQDDGNFDWSFVDGVPEGPVVQPPSGLRAGINAPGDEAGRYVSTALDEVDGEPVIHMAYQYRVRGEATSALRYARAQRVGGSWEWTFVDVDDLDVSGMFPSVFLTKAAPETTAGEGEGEEVVGPVTSGVGIVYMVRDIAVEAEDMPMQFFSEINVAYANVAAPTEAAEFAIEGIDQAENSVPCGGLCPDGSFCSNDMNTCLSRAAACGECAEGEVCLATEAGAACVAAVPGTKGGFSATPRGTGLFSSTVVAEDGRVHVAYYDQVHGNLMYAQTGLVDGVMRLVTAPMIVDGEVAGQSTGDVGRWARIHELSSGGVVIFYEDAGRAELRAAEVQGSTVNITVLDDGNYANQNRTKVQSNRVGSSVFSRALEAGGFEIFYQDTTNGVVRRLEWTNLTAAPSGHPHAVFGAAEGFERELTGSESPLDPSLAAVANNDGAVGFFTNVVEGIERTIFASKQINMPRGGSSTVPMHVTTGIIGHDVPDDEEPGDGEATP